MQGGTSQAMLKEKPRSTIPRRRDPNIQEKEFNLKSAKTQLSTLKSRIQQLESEITDAQNTKAKAETDLEVENAGK
jgi:chaperonin cofactor prefoldin